MTQPFATPFDRVLGSSPRHASIAFPLAAQHTLVAKPTVDVSLAETVNYYKLVSGQFASAQKRTEAFLCTCLLEKATLAVKKQVSDCCLEHRPFLGVSLHRPLRLLVSGRVSCFSRVQAAGWRRAWGPGSNLVARKLSGVRQIPFSHALTGRCDLDSRTSLGPRNLADHASWSDHARCLLCSLACCPRCSSRPSHAWRLHPVLNQSNSHMMT